MTEGTRDIGSLGEEAAKLFAAVADWAREQAGDAAAPTAAGAGTRLGDLLSQEHIATGAPECRWCPVCQAIGLLRSSSPEVKEHLASLVVVARQLLDSVADTVAPDAKPGPASAPDVEHIDLTEDDPWD
jgi:hypothetical protein